MDFVYECSTCGKILWMSTYHQTLACCLGAGYEFKCVNLKDDSGKDFLKFSIRCQECKTVLAFFTLEKPKICCPEKKAEFKLLF